jgi:hypothetical protein
MNMNINTSSVIKTILLIVLPLTSAIIYAESGLHGKKAHTHGVSKIELMISDETIRINLESPANNIVGFEHVASNMEEKNHLKRAHSILSTPASIFSFHGTHCKPISSSVIINGLTKEANEHHPHSTHKEITAKYQFECESSKNLTYIKTQLFNKFSNISEINVTWITDTKQGMSVLNPNNNQLFVE